ncbi:MAG: putative glycosyltransferase [Chloroflexi bacterium]|nr:putative glycosyltransferase [Chloroflexota bacterium]
MAAEPVPLMPVPLIIEAPETVEPTVLPRRSHQPSPASHLLRTAYVMALVVGDVCAIAAAFFVAYQLRGLSEPRPTRISPIGDYVPSLAFLVVSILITFALTRLYLPQRGASHVDRLGSLFVAVTIGNVVAMALAAFTLRGLDVPRLIIVYAWGLTIPFVWLARSSIEQLLRMARRRGLDPLPVLIVGARDGGNAVLHKIRGAPDLGYVPVGFVDDNPPPNARMPVLGGLADLSEILFRYSVREVIVANPSLSQTEVLDVVTACDHARVNVKILPNVFHMVVKEASVSEFSGLPMMLVRDVSLRGWNLLIKRALDIVIGLVLLIALAPVLMLVALIVKITDPRGPIFFIQERVGIDGQPFPCVKFRSMREDAEAVTGPVWATADDDRTTPVGQFLRRFSIDELPQLVNVLLGDMSLVGPRPERPHFVQQFIRLIPRYEKRHQEKAGMTGWAQVNGLRGQSSIEERTLYDLFYVEHWSPAFDVKVLLKTVAAVIRGHNAY